MGPVGLLGIVVGALVMIFVGVFVVVGVALPLARGIGWAIVQVGRFVIGEIADALRLAGATVTATLFIPLTLLMVFIGRWSAAAHYGKAIQGEVAAFCAALYRMAIGHPVALFHLTPLTEGVQRRLPEAVRAAPGKDKPPKRVGQFDGYTIVGSLKGGGSGGKLYVARADELKRATFERQGHKGVGQVVIKSFSLKDGSTLPQIIRESRALDAAKKLGLVLDHELTNERFSYVMRYVPGDSLADVTQRWHAKRGDHGLSDPYLSSALAHVMDVLRTLRVYHDGGLWHKDIKPDNIIVEGDRANVVDLGLVTPLRSNMTLTTHGTEYFRDPELVRLALRGVKVHQVDGAKFDIFATGAVLYSIVENSFPAHGVLSQVKKRCPEAIKWIIRRAMADYDQRYVSVGDMIADLDVVAKAADPFKIKPIDLPSMRSGAKLDLPEPPEHEPVAPVGGRFDAVWSRIREHKGERFKTATGLPFQYKMQGDSVLTDRTEYPLHRSNFEKAFLMGAMSGPGAYGDEVRGQSYVWAILHDARISAFPGVGGRVQAESQTVERTRPRLKVRDWLRGGYEVEGHETVTVAKRTDRKGSRTRGLRVGPVGLYVHGVGEDGVETAKKRGASRIPPERRRTAREQLEHARGRAHAARARAAERRASRTGTAAKAGEYRNSPNLGVGIAVVALGLIAGGAALLLRGPSRGPIVNVEGGGESLAVVPDPQLPGRPVALTPRIEGPLPDPTPPAQSDARPEAIGTGLTRTVGLAASSLGFAANQQLRGKRALVVYDARPPYTEKTERELRTRFDNLANFGLILVNSPFGTPDDDPEDLDVTELVADLSVRRGGRDIDSRGLGDQIGEWITDTPGIDFIVWIEPNALKQSDVLIELFAGTVTGGNEFNMPFQLLANYTVEQLVQPKRN